ncbi:MAG: 2-oxoacid:acceptor oxidoreductase subunit alpha [Alphaproteobacteria bacterium]
MAKQNKDTASTSLALSGSGGAGAITAGGMILKAAARAGLYGLFTRAVGPQIRGGEAVALLRLAEHPIQAVDDHCHLLVAMDWLNIERFADELGLDGGSLVVADPHAGEVPELIARSGAKVAQIPLNALAKSVKRGRPNMVAFGVAGALTGIPQTVLRAVVEETIGGKGEDAVAASLAALDAGFAAALDLKIEPRFSLEENGGKDNDARWIINGNEAAGFGAIRGGVRFVAAYPITPATEILEWMAPALAKTGGSLVQAEDELASINMIIGGAYGGVPSLTATSGPGLALMMESIGLAIAAEVPIVIVDVMRGGPSTGIPTKSEQSDLNLAIYGCHGDAPHLVVAPNSVADCLFTTQWAVHLAETLQAPAIVLSDQFLGQAKAVIERPGDIAFMANRKVEREPAADYARYAITADGVSPMALPGTPGGQYTADGLEHNPRGTPSTSTVDHTSQLDKRQRKLTNHDYGRHWAEIEGEGEVAVLTWGSSVGPVREALARLRAGGRKVRLVAPRLLAPAQPERLRQALDGVGKILVVEQTHSGQFLNYLRAHYELPGEIRHLCRPGPLTFRPSEIEGALKDWS